MLCAQLSLRDYHCHQFRKLKDFEEIQNKAEGKRPLHFLSATSSGRSTYHTGLQDAQLEPPPSCMLCSRCNCRRRRSHRNGESTTCGTSSTTRSACPGTEVADCRGSADWYDAYNNSECVGCCRLFYLEAWQSWSNIRLVGQESVRCCV